MATEATIPSESTGLPSEIADLQVKISNFKDEVRDITDLCFGFSIYEDLFEVDYNRLRIIEKLKISKFLSKIFLKSNPYLNILVFKKN